MNANLIMERVRRPPNAFFVWSVSERKNMYKIFPKLPNTEVSKLLGEKWRNLSPEEKQPYFREADRLKEEHKKKHPDYKYSPKRKRHVISEQTVSSQQPASAPHLPWYPQLFAQSYMQYMLFLHQIRQQQLSRMINASSRENIFL